MTSLCIFALCPAVVPTKRLCTSDGIYLFADSRKKVSIYAIRLFHRSSFDIIWSLVLLYDWLLQRNFMYWSMTCYVQVSKHALIAGERSTWIAIAQYLHLRIHSFSRCLLRRGCCDDDVDDFDRRWNFCRQLESKASTHTFRSQLNYLYTTQWENR